MGRVTMGKFRSRAVVVGLVLVLGLLAYLGLVVLRSGPRVRIIGSLPSGEIEKIKRSVHEDLFKRFRKSWVPGWVPRPLEKVIWNPVVRVVFDVKHPIDVIQVNKSETVVVWWRGPEMKSYVDGKEHGWFPRSVTMFKTSDVWTNSSGMLGF